MLGFDPRHPNNIPVLFSVPATSGLSVFWLMSRRKMYLSRGLRLLEIYRFSRRPNLATAVLSWWKLSFRPRFLVLFNTNKRKSWRKSLNTSKMRYTWTSELTTSALRYKPTTTTLQLKLLKWLSCSMVLTSCRLKILVKNCV